MREIIMTFCFGFVVGAFFGFLLMAVLAAGKDD